MSKMVVRMLPTCTFWPVRWLRISASVFISRFLFFSCCPVSCRYCDSKSIVCVLEGGSSGVGSDFWPWLLRCALAFERNPRNPDFFSVGSSSPSKTSMPLPIIPIRLPPLAAAPTFEGRLLYSITLFPICSFVESMRPPLWHESDMNVKVTPTGILFTNSLKSSSVHTFITTATELLFCILQGAQSWGDYNDLTVLNSFLLEM